VSEASPVREVRFDKMARSSRRQLRRRGGEREMGTYGSRGGDLGGVPESRDHDCRMLGEEGGRRRLEGRDLSFRSEGQRQPVARASL
jgi:hypothetical protein